MNSVCSYYDLDAILAEEELIPVTNLFPFNHLARLDPNYMPPTSSPDTAQSKSKKSKKLYLSSNTKFFMPLWSIDTWANLGFIKLGMPKIYAPKVRQRLQADPARVDLKRKSEWYYIAGMKYINLVQRSVALFRKSHSAAVRGGGRSSVQVQERMELSQSAMELKQALLALFSGSRYRVVFDWTLSEWQEDLSDFLEPLTAMEQELFWCGLEASQAHASWKLYGSKRIEVSETARLTQSNSLNLSSQKRLSKSSSGFGASGELDSSLARKRTRVT